MLTKGVALLDITKDIQSLTTFRRRSREFLRQLKKSKRPVVLTVNGKAEAVVQDAEAYQRLLDAAVRADVLEAIRQGADDAAKGRTRPSREVFSNLRRRRTRDSRRVAGAVWCALGLPQASEKGWKGSRPQPACR
jgi:prevent-host-death family protein